MISPPPKHVQAFLNKLFGQNVHFLRTKCTFFDPNISFITTIQHWLLFNVQLYIYRRLPGLIHVNFINQPPTTPNLTKVIKLRLFLRSFVGFLAQKLSPRAESSTTGQSCWSGSLLLSRGRGRYLCKTALPPTTLHPTFPPPPLTTSYQAPWTVRAQLIAASCGCGELTRRPELCPVRGELTSSSPPPVNSSAAELSSGARELEAFLLLRLSISAVWRYGGLCARPAQVRACPPLQHLHRARLHPERSPRLHLLHHSPRLHQPHLKTERGK